MNKLNALILALSTMCLSCAYGTDYVVTSQMANVYSGNTIMGSYPRGTMFRSDRQNNGWVMLVFQDGMRGWIALHDVSFVASQYNGNIAVQSELPDVHVDEPIIFGDELAITIIKKEIKRNRPNNIFFVSTAYDRKFDTWTTPSSSFMTLLKRKHSRARPFKSGVSRGIKIINPENSRNSLMYFIRIESYYPDGTLRVLAGSTRGILNAMGTAYRMMIVDGAWTIIDERPWAS